MRRWLRRMLSYECAICGAPKPRWCQWCEECFQRIGW